MHLGQRVTGKIGPSAARHDRSDIARKLSRCDQGRAGSRARAKIADGQLARGWLIERPFRGVDQPFGEQADVETVLRRIRIDRFLFTGEKIEEQSAKPGAIECPCHELIARTMAATPTAVREQNQRARAFGQGEGTGEHGRSGRNNDF